MMSIENHKEELESMSKEELIEYFYFGTDNYRNLSDKSALENIELEKQVNCLKQELEEKNTYEEKLNSMIDNLRDDISEQKAEIERLMEEIERQKDAKFQAVLDKYELRKINTELQKQVEELKITLKNVIESNEELIETCEQSVKDTAKEICYDIVCEGHSDPVGEKGDCGLRLMCEHITQAVKDTTKKYHDIMEREFMKSNNSNFYEFWCNFNNNIAKGFGVEVE